VVPVTVEITVVGTVTVEFLVDITVLTPVPGIVVVARGKVTVEMRPVGQDEVPETVLVDTTVLTPVPEIVVVSVDVPEATVLVEPAAVETETIVLPAAVEVRVT